MRQYLDLEEKLIRVTDSGRIRTMTATQLAKYLRSETERKHSISFIGRFENFIETKQGRTKELYAATLSRVKAFDRTAIALQFEDINKDWLLRFDAWLSITSPSANARAIHLRNIRAVFNDAIDNDITTHYPFRKFSIKREATRKRALTADQLREYFTCDIEKGLRKYRDIALLIFLLRGINIADLCYLDTIQDGYLVYRRKKTKRLYEIKIEPEAQNIIDKYKGKKYLLDILDSYDDYRDYARRLNEGLRKVGSVRVGKYNRKERQPLQPDITTYWFRHSWATNAAALDIPKETIAAALGHGGNTVTDIYINFDQKKVDDANRRVIDYILYNEL